MASENPTRSQLLDTVIIKLILHKNPYFSVKIESDYYSINFSFEQVVILPVINKNKILFIKSIRPFFEKPVIELPAGGVDMGESIKSAAMRELWEETGVKLKNNKALKSLAPLNTIPSRTKQMLNIFKADISFDEYEMRDSHDNEVAGLLLLDYKQAINKINSGEIFVATTVAVCLKHIFSSDKTYFFGEL
mgnify:CR=1 FL=1